MCGEPRVTLSTRMARSINAALMAAAAASSVGAGRSIYLNPAKSYWVTQSVVVPSGVALKCAAKIEKQHTNQNYVSDGCAIYSAPNLSATVDGALVSGAVINNGGTIEGIRVYQDNIHFAGQPTTAHQLASIIHNYTSTEPESRSSAQIALSKMLLSLVTIWTFRIVLSQEVQFDMC